MSSPLRIGILGAARIAKEGIVEPARVLGHELVAVAARDRGRAEAFAEEHGVRAVHETYAEVIADPQVDVVYNALVNSFHAEWNVAALEAGKNVLSEKPLTSNAEQARNLRDVAREATGTIVEGFHYIHHPVNQRLGELVTSGALGQVRQVELVLCDPHAAGDRPTMVPRPGRRRDDGPRLLRARRCSARRRVARLSPSDHVGRGHPPSGSDGRRHACGAWLRPRRPRPIPVGHDSRG